MSLPVFGTAKIKLDDVFDVVHAVAADVVSACSALSLSPFFSAKRARGNNSRTIGCLDLYGFEDAMRSAVLSYLLNKITCMVKVARARANTTF